MLVGRRFIFSGAWAAAIGRWLECLKGWARGAAILALNHCFGADYYGVKRATGDVMGAADRQLSLFGCARRRFA